MSTCGQGCNRFVEIDPEQAAQQDDRVSHRHVLGDPTAVRCRGNQSIAAFLTTRGQRVAVHAVVTGADHRSGEPRRGIGAVPSRHSCELVEVPRNTVEHIRTVTTGDLPRVRVVEIDIRGGHLTTEPHVDESTSSTPADHDRHVPERQPEARVDANLRADRLCIDPELAEREQQQSVEFIADSATASDDQLVDDDTRGHVHHEPAVDVEVLEGDRPMLPACERLDCVGIVRGERRPSVGDADARQVGIGRKSHTRLGHNTKDRLTSS